ncbi:MAG: tyrosine-type recombinase/integrase [Pseudomonadales bacterium]
MDWFQLGSYCMSVPYLHLPKNRRTWHYRRKVPSDLLSHYKVKFFMRSLKTRDEELAAKRCLKLNSELEQEFDRLRRGVPDGYSPRTIDAAIKRLAQYGLQPGDLSRRHTGRERPRHYDSATHETPPPSLADKFLEQIGELLHRKLSRPDYEAVMFEGKAIPEGVLPEVDKMAYDLLKEDYRPLASEYPANYLRLKKRENDKKFASEVMRAMDFLLEVLPDKSPGEYRRMEVRQLIDVHASSGHYKSATLGRNLGMVRAMFNKVAKEYDLKQDLVHPFTDFETGREVDDSTKRPDFTTEQLEILRRPIASRQPAIPQLIHLMLETGLRVNECCGLLVRDVVLETEYPYVIVQQNPFRRLKTPNSNRYIPLVGVALEAMRAAVNGKEPDDWVFPNYIDYEMKQSKNTAASAAVNKRLRAILGKDSPTCHSFRHTFKTRLRNVECPRDLQNEMGGWSKEVSDNYGSPTDIKIKYGFLLKAIDAPTGVKWNT